MDFLQEATILSQLKHPNIITFYGIVVDGMQVGMRACVSHECIESLNGMCVCVCVCVCDVHV